MRNNKMIKVLLTEDNKKSQALEFDGFYTSLRVSILIRRLQSRGDYSAATFLEDLIELVDKHTIAVTDEILNLQFCFARLLDKV